MSSKIYVGNISATTSEKDLLDLFSSYGEIMSVRITFGIDNQNTRRGYITMNDDAAAKNAIEKTNNTSLKGNKIKVVRAHPIDQKDDYFANQVRSRSYQRNKRV